MADGYLAWNILVLQERVRMLERRVERRNLRDAQDPFSLPHDHFMDTFRVSPDLAFEVIGAIRADLERERTTGLPAELQVLAALQFYAQGCYQRSVGDQTHLNISQTSVSRCVHAVTNAINQRLLRRWIRFPMTAAERAAARNKFMNAPQPFEGAIGAIDCTFIDILAPPEHEEAFVNHHGKHSLNVQAVVDPDLKVLNINARYPGARTDAYIWSQSPIRDAMQFHYDRGERHTWLIGDAGYPLEPWMTPLAHYPEGTRQFAYTHELCQARNVVERFFGVLKFVFRCLSYQRVLMYNPGMAGRLVNACAVLHNMRIHHRLQNDNFENDALPGVGGNVDVMEPGGNLDAERQQLDGRRGRHALGVRIQQQIMRDRFAHLRDGDE